MSHDESRGVPVLSVVQGSGHPGPFALVNAGVVRSRHVMNGMSGPEAVHMGGAVVAQCACRTSTEAAEHDSQNSYPVHGSGQRFRTRCAR